MSFLIEELLGHALSEVGILTFFVLWAFYQIYSPSWMPKTKFQKVVGNIEDEVRETKQLLVSTITVLRAVVRTNKDVDTVSVDEYLVENGVSPDDFLVGEDLPTDMNDRNKRNRGNPGDD